MLMLTFVFHLFVLALATWSLIGLYFDSVLFDGIRRQAEIWAKSPIPWKKRIGYVLECPYCLSHWVAGVLLLFLLIVPKFEMILLFVIAPKIAITLRDNLLGPISLPWDVTPETGNEAGAVIERQPDSESGGGT